MALYNNIPLPAKLINISGNLEKAAPRTAVLHMEDGVGTDRQTDKQTKRPSDRHCHM